MKHEVLVNDRAYGIPLVYDINGSESIVCIVIHGFGSGKQNDTAQMLFREFPRRGIGVIAFDFPAHDESEVNGTFLRISNCLADLAAVEARARSLAPNAEIVYFASSFGAYTTLIYLSGLPVPVDRPRRAFLRSAAVTMPKLFRERRTPLQHEALMRDGQVMLDKDDYGYLRDLIITEDFIGDLESHDVFEIWKKDAAELFMIIGTGDETTPPVDALHFSEKFKINRCMIPGGDHKLSIPGAPEEVLKQALAFFLNGTF